MDEDPDVDADPDEHLEPMLPDALRGLTDRFGVGLPLLALSLVAWGLSVVVGGDVRSQSCSWLCDYDYEGPREAVHIVALCLGATAVVGGIVDLARRRVLAGLVAVLGAAALTFWLLLLAVVTL